MNAPAEHRVGLLERLRGLTPRRPLTHREAISLAEHQAHLMRDHLELHDEPRLPTEALEGLPFMTVSYRQGFPTSGMATRTDFGWVIVIRSNDSPGRQRFSLAHELKHLIDDPFMHHHTGPLSRGLYPARPGYPRDSRIERICDSFAAALLMPKRALTTDWTEGLQAITALARRYGVSEPAMHYRLQTLGHLPRTPRCHPETRRYGERA